MYKLLTDEDPRIDKLRNNVNECLELAYRYDLVDADLEARLKRGDRESWQANINELVVAKLMEEIFGIGCLRWRPQGRKKRVGEFELVLNEKDIPVFVEIKTVFPRELEKLEHRIIEKLSRYAEQVPIPTCLNVHIQMPGISESFSSKKFKNYLTQELSALNSNVLGKNSFKLPDYKDNSTGLHLKIETLQITPRKDEKNCHIGIIGGEARSLENEVYIIHSLRKAYEQLPRGKQPCLVMICPSTAFPIDEDDMLNALLGHLAVRFYRHDHKPVTKPETFRQPDGFFQPRRNRKVSVVGLYKGRNVEKRLEIYHNPFAINTIPDSTFMDMKMGVRQLVKASNTEMKWLE
ncbi:MAG: hypothetical protein GH152_03740 [Dehalococcoidia bacterium]|nr:hypothetical protein [Dehalococcoidia bacterium]